MHAGIADTFGDGKKIDDTVAMLKQGPAFIKHLPAIKVAAVEVPVHGWSHEGANSTGKRQTMLFTEDHRRVAAARAAGIHSKSSMIRCRSQRSPQTDNRCSPAGRRRKTCRGCTR